MHSLCRVGFYKFFFGYALEYYRFGLYWYGFLETPDTDYTGEVLVKLGIHTVENVEQENELQNMVGVALTISQVVLPVISVGLSSIVVANAFKLWSQKIL